MLRRVRIETTGALPRIVVTICLAAVAAVTGASAEVALAQDVGNRKPLRVAVKPIEPFVFKHGAQLTGFSIDLWNSLAQSLNVETVWVEVATVGEQLQAVRTGKADVAIAAITITREREDVVDFTTPYFDAGLQIMVHAQSGNRFGAVFDSFPWRTIGVLLALFVALMMVMAHVLWLLERRTSDFFSKGYVRGIGEGLWAVALIVATGEHGDRQTCRVVKRIMVFFMWLAGVVLIAQLTGTISSTQTVERLNSNIRGPGDLPGKTIATVGGTFAADYLGQQGLQHVDVATVDEACDLVLKGDVQAVIFDAPTLQYVATKRGNGLLQVVGPIFAPQKYGIAVADGSPLRKRLDRALLQIYEDGRYRALYNQWFSRG